MADRPFQKKRRLIFENDLREKGITYSRAHRNRLIKAGVFPAPVEGVGKVKPWVEDEIDAYVDDRIAARARQHGEDTTA